MQVRVQAQNFQVLVQLGCLGLRKLEERSDDAARNAAVFSTLLDLRAESLQRPSCYCSCCY